MGDFEDPATGSSSAALAESPLVPFVASPLVPLDPFLGASLSLVSGTRY